MAWIILLALAVFGLVGYQLGGRSGRPVAGLALGLLLGPLGWIVVLLSFGRSASDDSRSAPGESPKGGETILVVDDEQPVRDLARRMLESGGYRVIDADGADAALRLVERHSGPIDVLMTDVVMPGKSGYEFAGELAAQRPFTRVIYTSGFSREAITDVGDRDDFVAFLPKPFSREGLLQEVRNLLDS